MAITRLSAAFVTAVFLATGVAPAAPFLSRSDRGDVQAITVRNSPVRLRVTLHDGNTATVQADGLETLVGKKGNVLRQALAPVGLSATMSGDVTASQADLLAPLLTPKPMQPFVPNQLIVVFREGDGPSQDVVTVPKAQLRRLRAAKPSQLTATAIPAYSNDHSVNRIFAEIGVDRLTRIARNISRSRLAMLHAQAVSKAGGAAVLNIADAFVVHFTNARIDSALTLLRKQSGVAYAEHNWYVSTVRPPALALTAHALAEARERDLRSESAPHELRAAQSYEQHAIPSNYAVSASAQSLLNAPGVNAVKAYDEIYTNFHQYPGQGETIANISEGDVDDTANSSDPCYAYAVDYGPSVHLISGQHYIDWPSMPLIPAYVVDSSGEASGSAEACGLDPSLGEVGLDFSMMAPLPHQLQRPGETGSGYSDLLGIAPGAKYELYVPQADGTSPATSDILSTFLAAADSTSPPDVITASLGFGYDTYGFPGRFFEDDPLVQSTITGIVKGLGIIVCLSANDGTRLYTNAAIGSSGGSAATELVSPPAGETDLEDLEFSTIPSHDYDSGSIDVGGTTLDDIFAAPLNGSASTAAYQNQLTWPETRWTGFADFSSGFGSRVNISAPSDNVLQLAHTCCSGFAAYDNVTVENDGGTSAAAPEVAAIAAVALQVARLTGHPFSSPQALRSFLIKTARKVPNVPQADTTVNVGPQADLGNVVDTLLAEGGKHPSFAAPRVAIAQRRQVTGTYDGTFFSDTAPDSIDMQEPNGQDSYAPITLAPDWEGVPAGAKYRLTIANKPSTVLATTPWVRLTPGQILAAAGLPSASSSNRTVNLEYVASFGPRQASAYFSLTFGPAPTTHQGGVAPTVAPVTSGSTMHVSYNLAGLQDVHNAVLIVSEPGRMSPISDLGYPELFHPAYSVALTQTSGTVEIPVNKLQGAGIYGVAVEYAAQYGESTTDFAFTRVAAASSTQANPVTLSSDGVNFSHNLGLNYAQQYQVHWDVSNVPNATGGIIEVSPPAPNNFGNYNSFNNPNGSIPDNNGVDTGSIYKRTVSGKSGTITLDSATTLTTALWNTIRVIPMNGSMPAGEAGPVSVVTEDGIVPPDGLPLEAFTTGDGQTGSVTTNDGAGDADAFSFSETSPYDNMNLLDLSSSDGVAVPEFYYPTGTVFSGDQQMMEFYYANALSPNVSYIVNDYLWGLDNGHLTQLQPPSGCSLSSVAYNRESDLAVSLLGATNAASSSCYASNPNITRFISSMTLPNTTFGTPLDAGSAYYPTALFGKPVCVTVINSSCQLPEYYVAGSFEADPGLNEAIVEVGSAVGESQAEGSPVCSWQGHEVSTISLSNGTVTTFATGGLAYPTQSSYDSGNHVLVSPDVCGNLVITNVGTQTNTVIPLNAGLGSLPSAPSEGAATELPSYDVVDSVNHVILIGFALDPAFETNNAAMSVIDEYNENGDLLKTVRNVQFDNMYLNSYLQIDEKTRTMFVPELTNSQMQPLTY